MTIEAEAKINLTLEVFAKRADGYHALRSLVLPVSLADTLVFEPADAFSTDTGYPDDLILKAARILAASRGTGILPVPPAPQPYRVRVIKRIPAGGGLGGGSADAAATLRALNALWGRGLSPMRLAEIGASVGSDVPALVLAQALHEPIVMEGRGELVSRGQHGQDARATVAAGCGHTDARSALNIVLAFPGVFSSTPEVFRHCVPREPDDGTLLNETAAALAEADFDRLAAVAVNDLQKPALALHPEIGAALQALRAAGALVPMMSGSGSTVFGFAPSSERAEEIAAHLAARGLRAVAARTWRG